MWVGAARMLAGTQPVVQGFETSRYPGAAYDTETRIRTMRHAQIISGIIYIVFLALASPLLATFHGTRDETAIITMSGQVAAVLPAMLVLAAIVAWSANIFEIIVLASRAFAFYYFLQCVVGLIASSRATRLKNGYLWRTYLLLMALVLLLVVLFATSEP